MALYDDKRFLLSHIRHSFITGDDTAVCEMVMLHEVMPHLSINEPDANALRASEIEVRSELEVAQSYDIVSNIEMIGAHRRRSNTAQRLERLRLEKKNQAKVKVIQWKDGPETNLTEEELDLWFPRKELPSTPPANRTVVRSLLTQQLEQCPSLPVNPFNEYSRFDGRVGEGGATKRIVIFISLGDGRGPRQPPIEVVTLCSARVQDLIGLICWQYTNEDRQPRLQPHVTHYGLRIAEENGDVDPDFPSLNPREPVGKFGFPVLALVEKQFEEGSGLVVTVHIGEMFSKIQIPHLDVTLQWVLDSTVKKRKVTLESGTNFGLERLRGYGSPLDLNMKLGDVEEREFKLVTLDSVSEQSNDPAEIETPDLGIIEAPLYKCFQVEALQKLGRSAEVQLGISGKKVDITPIAPAQSSHRISSSKLWKSWQPKPVSYNVENIVECEINAQKSTADRTVFKIVVYCDKEFISHKFESIPKVATEIVKKLQYIMAMRTSALRGEWTNVKEQQKQRKLSHSHFPGFS